MKIKCIPTWGFIKLNCPDENPFTLIYQDKEKTVKIDFMGYTPEEAVEKLLERIESEEELI